MTQHPLQKNSGGNVLYISTFEDVRVRVHAPSLKQQWDQQENLKAGSVKTITLPGSIRTGGSTGKEGRKGIRITANKPIAVCGKGVGTNDKINTGEGFLGLPVDALGNYYIIPTFFAVINSFVQVVAREDNTQVSFLLRLPKDEQVSHGDKVYRNGQFINVTINDLDVFQVLSGSDLTGTTVTSSKPVAVFSGNDCAMVPSDGKWRRCNHLVEQIPPVKIWGQHFITSPTPNNPGGDEFHVIAGNESTNVQVDRQFKKVLNKGDSYVIRAPWNESLEIYTNHPSLVVQYTYGDGLGLPSMSIVPPREWVSNDYAVYVAGGAYAYDGYLNVVLDTSLRGGLRVRGPISNPLVRGPLSNVLINWNSLSGGFSSASLHLSRSGFYLVYHDSPLANFTAVMYGMSSKKLLSFPAGLKFEVPDPNQCLPSQTKGGDQVDNDCDGRTDEELKNGKDDDGDGKVDEDLATPLPDIIMPKDFVTPPLLSCGPSSNVDDIKQPGFHPTPGPNATQGVCYLRGKINTSHRDTVGKRPGCVREFERVWTVRDACQNVITHNQRIKIITPEDPVLTFPGDITLFCRDKKYLAPEFTGEVLRDENVCRRNVTITYRDTYTGDCSSSEAKLERVWSVEDKCLKSFTKTQVIKLVPKG